MKQRPIRENRLVVYRHRKLPHWQAGGSWYFVTYRAMAITLTAVARDAVRESIVRGHGGKYRGRIIDNWEVRFPGGYIL